MAIHSDVKKHTIESLKEDLVAVEYCIKFEKSDEADWGSFGIGCLGSPAFILLCSMIDSMGAYFHNTSAMIRVDGEERKIQTVADHFLILNHDKLFKFKISAKIIYEFYTKYRSPATHDNTLPLNRFLDIGNENDDIFVVDVNGELDLVRLRPLFVAVKFAVNEFSHYLKNGNWSDEHWLTNDLNNVRGKKTAPSQSSPSASGSANVPPTII
ncbi:hypothetical protein [Chryseolinea lacunae]|uniref:Uncharacterized protein n=1 Tax=Chryseolinea lacunae TaxID=2801331 RepID=A0ABS1KKG1_9BACT|nr:hypothetical protein [Chryseolinea lacunae]MBL0739946.1 hypothetical protein [Chryseolinea lacunae]